MESNVVQLSPGESIGPSALEVSLAPLVANLAPQALELQPLELATTPVDQKVFSLSWPVSFYLANGIQLTTGRLALATRQTNPKPRVSLHLPQIDWADFRRRRSLGWPIEFAASPAGRPIELAELFLLTFQKLPSSSSTRCEDTMQH